MCVSFVSHLGRCGLLHGYSPEPPEQVVCISRKKVNAFPRCSDMCVLCVGGCGRRSRVQTAAEDDV